MVKVSGKYYWVKTEQGVEIAHQRYSGQWELCGISAGEIVNDAILEVIGEVANDVSDTDKPCALGGVVNCVYVVTERDNYGEQLFKGVFANREKAVKYLAEDGLRESNIDEITEIELA